MPWDSVTGKAARKNQKDDKKARDDAWDEQLREARHMKKMYDFDYTGLQKAFQIQKSQHRNYPIPCIQNIKGNGKPSKYNMVYKKSSS